MRLMVAALVLTLAVAITASAFAIWPAVGHAPWEASGHSGQRMQCQAALDLRSSLLLIGIRGQESSQKDYSDVLADTQKLINLYC